MEEINAFGRVYRFNREKVAKVDNPTTSIIIPAYNAEKLLPRAVISTLTQDTSFTYEVVIVDDGSQRKVKDTLETVIQDDPKISIVRQTNGRIPVAVNLGVLLSRGKNIIRLDSDDELLPGAVETMTAHLNANPETVHVYTDGFWVGPLEGWEWEKYSPVPLDNKSYVNPWIKREFSIRTLLGEMFLGHAQGYRRSAFFQVGGFDTNLTTASEDWDFALKLSEIGRVDRIPEKLHKYYLQDGGFTKTQDQTDRHRVRRGIALRAINRRGLLFSEIPKAVIDQFNLSPEEINRR